MKKSGSFCITSHDLYLLIEFRKKDGGIITIDKVDFL